MKGILLMDDFAHHPTAVKETLAGVRNRYPGRRIVTVFEPRTNTSRRKVFQEAYAEAFSEADIMICAPVYRPEAFTPGERFSPAVLVEDLRNRGGVAYCFETSEAVEQALLKTCRPGDVVLFMSSGSFADLFEGLKTKLDELIGADPEASAV